MTTVTDIEVYANGSFVGITPLTLTARQWIDENVKAEGWQWLGDTLWVDVRYADDLILGALDAGLEVKA
jgi:hypothetical protein